MYRGLLPKRLDIQLLGCTIQPSEWAHLYKSGGSTYEAFHHYPGRSSILLLPGIHSSFADDGRYNDWNGRLSSGKGNKNDSE
jgi:hypothetical protein